jgi:FkbM family methyltransferase
MDLTPKFLIDLEQVAKEKGLNVKGVIHVGAHYAEEQPVYDAIGAKKTIWVEGNSDLIPNLRSMFENRTDVGVLYAVVSDQKKTATFQIHNDTHTSSILDMDFIAESHPELEVIGLQLVETISLDELVKESEIEMSDYNFLTLDIQGVEYEALLGFTEGLKHIDYVYVEVETKNLYVGGMNYDKIKKLMELNGFELVTEHIRHWFWGDCLYQRKH